MPGKKITDHQVHKYKHHRNTLTQIEAAAKATLTVAPDIEPQSCKNELLLHIYTNRV